MNKQIVSNSNIQNSNSKKLEAQDTSVTNSKVEPKQNIFIQHINEEEIDIGVRKNKLLDTLLNGIPKIDGNNKKISLINNNSNNKNQNNKSVSGLKKRNKFSSTIVSKKSLKEMNEMDEDIENKSESQTPVISELSSLNMKSNFKETNVSSNSNALNNNMKNTDELNNLRYTYIGANRRNISLNRNMNSTNDMNANINQSRLKTVGFKPSNSSILNHANNGYLTHILCKNCEGLIRIDNIEKHTDDCSSIKEEIVVNDLNNNESQHIDFKLEKIKEYIETLLSNVSKSLDESYLSSLFHSIEISRSLSYLSEDSKIKLKNIINGISSILLKFKGSLQVLILYDRARILLNYKYKLIKKELELKDKRLTKASKNSKSNLNNTVRSNNSQLQLQLRKSVGESMTIKGVKDSIVNNNNNKNNFDATSKSDKSSLYIDQNNGNNNYKAEIQELKNKNIIRTSNINNSNNIKNAIKPSIEINNHIYSENINQVPNNKGDKEQNNINKEDSEFKIHNSNLLKSSAKFEDYDYKTISHHENDHIEGNTEVNNNDNNETNQLDQSDANDYSTNMFFDKLILTKNVVNEINSDYNSNQTG